MAARLAVHLVVTAHNSPGAINNTAVTDNPEASRFELRDQSTGEIISFADYQNRDGTLVVPHVETSMAHRGQGNADRLMAGIVTHLRSTNRKITPLCPFAAGYLRDRPETHDLLG